MGTTVHVLKGTGVEEGLVVLLNRQEVHAVVGTDVSDELPVLHIVDRTVGVGQELIRVDQVEFIAFIVDDIFLDNVYLTGNVSVEEAGKPDTGSLACRVVEPEERAALESVAV